MTGDIDDLVVDIAEDERVHASARRRIEELSEVFRATTQLWQARQRRGLSVEQVAEATGLSLEQVEAIEDSAVDCPFDTLARYGRVVGLQFDLRPVSAA